MGNNGVLCAAFIGAALLISSSLQAATINFDDVAVGSHHHGINTNNDSINEIVFSTTDPLGFSNENPYLNNPEFYADFITGTVLGISTNSSVKVDFINGVKNSFSFSYVFFSTSGGNQVMVDVFDSNDSLLNSSLGRKHGSSSNINHPPNSFFNSVFTGTASYALIHASGNGSDRFGINSLRGVFSPNDSSFFAHAIPIPATVWLFAPVILGLAGIRRRKK